MSYRSTIQNAWRDNHLVSVLMELTYACNLDCEFCYNDRNLKGAPLSLDQYRTFLEDLVEMDVLRITLSGGEPLAHPRFFEIGRMANEMGFVTRIKTNGHGLGERIAKRIKDEIDPYTLEISLHGATAETHDRQTRVSGSFERLMANLETISNLEMRVQINSTLTSYNENEVEGMYEICDRLNLKLQMDTEVKARDDGDEAPRALSASDAALSKLRTFRLQRGRHLMEMSEGPGGVLPKPTEIREQAFSGVEKHCGAGSSGVCLDPVGNILPCVQWRIPAGNLHTQRIHDIWKDSVVLDEVRSTTVQAKELVDRLGEGAGAVNFCPGAAHAQSGDALKLYPDAYRRLRLAEQDRIQLRVI